MSKRVFYICESIVTKYCMSAEIMMRLVHEPQGWVHRTLIKIQAKVHYFVTILEHKVNTPLLF